MIGILIILILLVIGAYFSFKGDEAFADFIIKMINRKKQ